MGVLEIILILVAFILSVLLHELAHLFIYRKYDEEAKMFIYFNGFKTTPFVTPKKMNKFYYDLYEKDKKNAWKLEIAFSASGLCVNLILFLVCLIISFKLDGDIKGLTFIFSIAQLLIVIGNFITDSSDGKRIFRALRYKDGYYDWLKKNNYNYTSKELESFIRERYTRIEKKKTK